MIRDQLTRRRIIARAPGTRAASRGVVKGIGVVGLIASLVLSATPVTAKPAFRIYHVQAGDSCWSIALRLFGKGEKYTLIHRYNRLGPLPHLLRPGQALRLPLSAHTPDAHIDWLRRDVRARAPYAVDWRHAQPAMGLWRLYKVATGSASAAGIAFEDASHLRMRERALLVIYGAAATRTKLRSKVKTQVKIEEGTVVGGLERLDAARALRIQTPSALVALRSRRSQIEVNRRKSSLVSVHDGKAAVSAQGAQVSVPAGYGTRVRHGEKPAKPRPLPPAPPWFQTGDGLIPLPAGARGSFEARWRAVPRAQRYRVELARDRAFRFPVAVAVVGAKVTRFRAQDLAAGDYYGRVSAIDRWGLEGAASTKRRWRLAPLQTSRRLISRPDGSFEAVGIVRLALPGIGPHEVSVDGGPFRSAAAARLSAPGLHRLRYRLKKSPEIHELRVRLLRVVATLDLPPRPLPPRERVIMTMHLRDERGHAAALPELGLLVDGQKQTLATTPTAGTYQATFIAPSNEDGRAALPVKLRWALGTLATATLPLARPKTPSAPSSAPTAKPVMPESFPLPRAGAPLLEWGGPAGLGLPSRDDRPRSYLRLSSHLGALRPTDTKLLGNTHRRASDPLPLRLALGAGLALAQDRIGLDLEMPWYQSDLERDEAGQNDLGNLRVGARFIAWQRSGFTLTPSLRVTIPTANPGADRRATTFEPAAILAWRGLNDRLVINTNLVLPLQTDFDSLHLIVGQTLGAAYRVWRGLSLGLELDALISLHATAGKPRIIPILAGAQASYGAHRYRITVTTGAGLDTDAQRRYGRFSVGLSAEIFFSGR